MKNKSTYQKTVEASTANLSEVREFVAKNAHRHNFEPRLINDIQLAVDEAYTNIIKHAYKNNPDEKVVIDLEFDEEKLIVTLTDQGVSFNLEKYQVPNIREQIKQKKRGGMGVYLIQKLMDEVSYHTERQKNRIRMCKNRA